MGQLISKLCQVKGQTISKNFKRSDPGCHGNKIWDKIGYYSICM